MDGRTSENTEKLMRLPSSAIVEQALLSGSSDAATAAPAGWCTADSSAAAANLLATSRGRSTSGKALPPASLCSQPQTHSVNAELLLLEELQRAEADMFPDLFSELPAAHNATYSATDYDDFFVGSEPSTPIVHQEPDVPEASPIFNKRQLAGNHEEDDKFSGIAEGIHWSGSNKVHKRLPQLIRKAAARRPFMDIAAVAHLAQGDPARLVYANPAAKTAARVPGAPAAAAVARQVPVSTPAAVQPVKITITKNAGAVKCPQHKPGCLKPALRQPASQPQQGHHPQLSTEANQAAGAAATAAVAGVPAAKNYYSIIAEMLATAAAAGTPGATSSAIAAAALSAALAAANASATAAMMQEPTGHGTPAGNTYPQVLGKRWERDWEQQPAGVNPACTAARKETQQASVVSAIQPAAGGPSTGAPGESSSSVQCSGAQGGACSPAKKRIRLRDSLPGHSLQEFRLFLKHEPPFKVADPAGTALACLSWLLQLR